MKVQYLQQPAFLTKKEEMLRKPLALILMKKQRTNDIFILKEKMEYIFKNNSLTFQYYHEIQLCLFSKFMYT